MSHSTFQRPSRRQARLGILFCPTVSWLASTVAPPFGPYVLFPQRRMGPASLRTFQESDHVFRLLPRPRIAPFPGYDARRFPRRSLALQGRGGGSS